MSTVNIRQGIWYGLGLIGYIFGVGIVAFIIAAIGWVLAQGEGTFLTVLGGLILLVGFVVFYAGILGIGYKVIADAVSIGVSDAGGVSTPTDQSTGERDR